MRRLTALVIALAGCAIESDADLREARCDDVMECAATRCAVEIAEAEHELMYPSTSCQYDGAAPHASCIQVAMYKRDVCVAHCVYRNPRSQIEDLDNMESWMHSEGGWDEWRDDDVRQLWESAVVCATGYGTEECREAELACYGDEG